MLLTDLLSAEHFVGECPNVQFDLISRDPNNCKDCALFCLVGNGFSERDFIEKAIFGEARLIISDIVLPECKTPSVTVKNARLAYSFAWSALCGDPQDGMHIYAITGTNGKTSTSYFLHSLLDYCGIRNALIGTTGIIADGKKIPFPPEDSGISQMTTPDPELLYPLLSELKRKGIYHAVMEVSSHSLALYKVDPITFDVALFTNFKSDHLDFHKTVEKYRAAKLRLASLALKCIYNSDDPALFDYFKARRSISYGTEKGDYTACCIRNYGVNGVSYLLKYFGTVMRIESPIGGSFTVTNTLAACALATEIGIYPETVGDAISAVRGIPGRLESLALDSTKFPFSVLIDYAHTPDALEKLLTSDLFRGRSARLITLFGCGGDRDRTKRAPMGRIAAQYSDKVYITSDNPRNEDPDRIIEDILKGLNDNDNYTVIPDREEAIVAAFNECRKNDILLLVGKGHEHYIVDKGGRRRFSEKEIVERAAAGKYKKGCNE